MSFSKQPLPCCVTQDVPSILPTCSYSGPTLDEILTNIKRIVKKANKRKKANRLNAKIITTILEFDVVSASVWTEYVPIPQSENMPTQHSDYVVWQDDTVIGLYEFTLTTKCGTKHSPKIYIYKNDKL